MKRLCLLVAAIIVAGACTRTNTSDLTQLQDNGWRGIVNGEIAAGKYRNVGALLTAGEFTCTATLITPSVVLTAAHCVDWGNAGNVLPDITFTREIGSGVEARATDYRVHPDYFAGDIPTNLYADYLEGIDPQEVCELVPAIDFDTGLPVLDDNGDPVMEEQCYFGFALSGSDVALIKLSKRFDDFVPYSLGNDNLADNASVVAVGFGRDEREIAGIKRLGTMFNFGYFDSQVIDRSTMSSPLVVEDGYIITKPDSANQVGCFGDSGSPLLKNASGTPTIQGVLSLALFDLDDYAGPSFPTEVFDTICNDVDGNAYVSMDPYRSWILAQMEELDPAGTCKADDANFGGLAGGCLHKRSGKVFSKVKTESDQLTSSRVGRSSASSYCANLVEGGRDDWRLPTASELIAVAQDGAFETLELGEPRYYWYWSSTNSGLSPDSGTAVRLSDGRTHVGYPLHQNYPLSVVCVGDE